jgi:hypothetical protein
MQLSLEKRLKQHTVRREMDLPVQQPQCVGNCQTENTVKEILYNSAAQDQ